MVGGVPPRPSDFQSRYARPSPSTNGLGSIDPPSAAWQTRGPAESSMNGPAGVAETAREMHCRCDAAWRTV
jgi:hypothetical protein